MLGLAQHALEQVLGPERLEQGLLQVLGQEQERKWSVQQVLGSLEQPQALEPVLGLERLVFPAQLPGEAWLAQSASPLGWWFLWQQAQAWLAQWTLVLQQRLA